MKNGLLYILSLMLLSAPAYADGVDIVAKKEQDLNFGGIIQLANYNTLGLRVNSGEAIWLRCMKSGTQPKLGQISFESPMEDGISTLVIKPTIAAEADISAGCRIKVKNLALSATTVTLTTSAKKQALDIGGTLEIEGSCAANTYNGTINVDYSVQNPDTTDIVRTGTIALPITLEIKNNAGVTRDNDMNFGTVISSGEAGTVVLDTDGNSTYSGGVVKVVGKTTAGQISIYGTPNLEITGVNYPGSIPICLNGNSGSSCMTVSNFTRYPVGTFSLDEYINGQGYKMLKIGGTLNIGENQPVGEYSGTLNVRISY